MQKNCTLIILLLTMMMTLSCGNEKEPKSGKNSPQSTKIEIPTQDTGQIQHPDANMNETKELKVHDSLDISFLGKTTEDLNKYHLQECFGVVIEQQTDLGKYGVAQYSALVDNCRHGKSKITLEKVIQYFPDGKAGFQIKDELTVNSNYPKKCYSPIYLKLRDDKSKRIYLIEYEDNSEPVLTKVSKIWEINIKQEKFIERSISKNFICQNPNYADGV